MRKELKSMRSSITVVNNVVHEASMHTIHISVYVYVCNNLALAHPDHTPFPRLQSAAG